MLVVTVVVVIDNSLTDGLYSIGLLYFGKPLLLLETSLLYRVMPRLCHIVSPGIQSNTTKVGFLMIIHTSTDPDRKLKKERWRPTKLHPCSCFLVHAFHNPHYKHMARIRTMPFPYRLSPLLRKASYYYQGISPLTLTTASVQVPPCHYQESRQMRGFSSVLKQNSRQRSETDQQWSYWELTASSAFAMFVTGALIAVDDSPWSLIRKKEGKAIRKCVCFK